MTTPDTSTVVLDTLTVDGLTDDAHRTLNMLLAQLRSHRPRNRVRSAYYDGKRVLGRMASGVIPPEYYRLGIALGWTGRGVDALARRVRFTGFNWADGDLDTVGAGDFLEDSSFIPLAQSARVAAFTHGVSFIVNLKGGVGEPRSLVQVVDALNGTGEWNMRTRRLSSFLAVNKWDEDAPDRPERFTLFLPNVTISAAREGGKWQVVHETHGWGVPVEPVVYRQTATRMWGQSRITRPVMNLQDRGLESLIRLEAHSDVYSFPDLIVLGADAGAFTLADGSPNDAWKVIVGRVKGLPDAEDAPDGLQRADVKSVQAASPEPHLAQLNAISKLFAREMGLPDAAVAITDYANPTSAESYDASQHELVAEAEDVVAAWTVPHKRAFIRGLLMQNGLREAPRDWGSIEPVHRNPRFESQAAVADAGQKRIAAVPWLAETEVGLELLGLTPDQIRRATADRRRASLGDTIGALLDRDTAAPASVSSSAEDAQAMRAKFDALGIAVRAGVDPDDAANRLGLSGVKFTGAIPVALRPPADDATKLEDL